MWWNNIVSWVCSEWQIKNKRHNQLGCIRKHCCKCVVVYSQNVFSTSLLQKLTFFSQGQSITFSYHNDFLSWVSSIQKSPGPSNWKPNTMETVATYCQTTHIFRKWLLLLIKSQTNYSYPKTPTPRWNARWSFVVHRTLLGDSILPNSWISWGLLDYWLFVMTIRSNSNDEILNPKPKPSLKLQAKSLIWRGF